MTLGTNRSLRARIGSDVADINNLRSSFQRRQSPFGHLTLGTHQTDIFVCFLLPDVDVMAGPDNIDNKEMLPATIS
jgi:hypothetical protein